MPSPFPGMDPFLEDPEYWHDIHVMLIAELSRFLNRALPEGLVAHIERAVELPHLEIVTARGQKQVVTAIEILSPVNKSGQGRTQYQQKQQEILLSHTHLLEIDLLRGGEHTVAVPLADPKQDTEWDYIVCLHRAGAAGVEFWDIDLHDSLPEITIPLTPEHPDLVFPFQAAFERIYDDGPFRREVDYTNEPTPRLKGHDAQWADQLLRAGGLRRE
ncbi:DUF4058 family protein [Armatimonas sp.]|uniref:DUF4058 family protein n=1 Tax=Armatimonas sp. TaxID=1872638 RepID=UPI0037500D94